MKVAMLSPISWRTPPRHYGPWESIVSLLTETLLDMGVEVTLFASGDSITQGELVSVCSHPYSEDPSLEPKVWECLHIAELFSRADEFDLIHNHYDFLPLSYSSFSDTPMVTTIHGFSSPSILPVYKKYNDDNYYVSISNSDRAGELDYIDTVYHGIDLKQFPFVDTKQDYLLFFGRIHPHKGVHEAIKIARLSNMRLVIAGIIQDQQYFDNEVKPYIDGSQISYIGSVGPERRKSVLGGARAMLHLINFDEPFGLSVIESLACGTPVIAYRRGSMPEIIRDCETGFIVGSASEAVEALANIGSIDNNNCRTDIEQRFTCQRMAQDYLKVYQKILSERENHRPWGFYIDLVERNDHKVKELYIEAGQRLSLQKHERRAEHWTVIKGEAVVTIDERELSLKAGDSIDVPLGASHRIYNPNETELVIVEVQLGDYFGEDDIIRFADDYEREISKQRE